MPAFLLIFLNYFGYIFVMSNFYTFPFFQPTSPSAELLNRQAYISIGAKKQQEKREQAMSEDKKCSKCEGEMVEGAAEIFGNIFGCTREPKNLEALQGEKIQSYYCKNCGYIEFYKE